MCKAIYKSKKGEGQKNDPPEPQYEEEVLVEDVIGENTDSTLPIIATTTNRSSAEITGNLCRKEIAHGVTSPPTTVEIIDSHAILPEITVKKTVKDLETGEEQRNVKDLAEGK